MDKSDKWGVRKLAYRVQKRTEGFYVLLQFTAKPETVQEMERRLRVTDLVMKFMTVRIDEKLKKIEKRKKDREKRAARKPAAPAAAPSAPSAEHAMAGAAEPSGPRPGAPMPGAPAAPRRQPRLRPGRRNRRIMAESRGGRPISASQRPTGGDKAMATKKQYFRRKKVCRFCVEKIDDINYKDVRHAVVLHLRARQDRAAAHFGRLHSASEAAWPRPSSRRATSR